MALPTPPALRNNCLGQPAHFVTVPRPPLRKHGRGPKVQAKQRFNAHPVLSHNPTMVVTLRHHTGNISFHQSRNAAELRPRVVQTRRSRDHSLRMGSGAADMCLDKAVLAHDAHNSKARYVTAMPGIATLAMAENHIKSNSIGLQCVVQYCYEQNGQSQT